MQQIIDRDSARDRGLTSYYTGKPCKHGHDSMRYVSNARCIECKAAAKRSPRKATPAAAKPNPPTPKEPIKTPSLPDLTYNHSGRVVGERSLASFLHDPDGRPRTVAEQNLVWRWHCLLSDDATDIDHSMQIAEIKHDLRMLYRRELNRDTSL